MEDGEIRDEFQRSAYHPSLEWPGEEYSNHAHDFASHAESAFPPSDPSTASVRTNQDSTYPLTPSYAPTSIPSARPSLRLIRILPDSAELLRQSHAVMSKTQTLAIIDGYSQVQFGRDAAPAGSDTPRIRLKEMEVSKLHATIYWDEDRSEWAIVDMGSKHGTYVRPSPTAASSSIVFPDPRGHRLSPPRMSSIPRPIKHLDEVSLGTTTFVVHMHADQLPCEACTSAGGEEIALFKATKAEGDASRKRKRADAESAPAAHADSRKSLAMLKRSLLSRHNEQQPPLERSPGDKRAYVDRSARRRALHPTAHDPPGSASPFASNATTPGPSSRATTPPSAEPVSEPSAPLPSSNIGHRLLMKQGWVPGSVLGSAQDSVEGSGESVALTEPIEVTVRAARSGLGVSNQVPVASSSQTAGLSWQEEAKRRRWAELGRGGS